MKWVIFSIQENAYWNNEEGWTTTNPTIFTDAETKTFNLPIGDSEWVPYTNQSCRRCCNPVIYEQDDIIDYPYYCPDCAENKYSFEVENKYA